MASLIYITSFSATVLNSEHGQAAWVAIAQWYMHAVYWKVQIQMQGFICRNLSASLQNHEVLYFLIAELCKNFFFKVRAKAGENFSEGWKFIFFLIIFRDKAFLRYEWLFSLTSYMLKTSKWLKLKSNQKKFNLEFLPQEARSLTSKIFNI